MKTENWKIENGKLVCYYETALSFCKNADDIQEIRDLIEENEVPLSLAEAWIIFPTIDANRLSKTDDCVIER